MTTPPPPAQAPPPLGRETSPRLSDFTEDLLWPRLLRAVPMAMRPERLLVALVMLALTLAIGELAGPLYGKPNFAGFAFRHVVGAVDGIATGIVNLESSKVRDEVRSLMTVSTLRAWERYGLGVFFLGLPILLVWALGGCAICRMVACDFSKGVLLTARRGVGFALARPGTLLVAALGPLLLAAFFALVIAVFGFLLLRWPAVQVVGGALYGLPLLVGAVAMVVLVCYVAGTPMLIPAVAVEGADGIDAVQRSFAYVVGRPLQLLLYGVVVLLVGWGTLVFFDLVIDALLVLTAWAAAVFAGSAATDVLQHAPHLDGRGEAAHRMIEAWEVVPRAVVGALATSYFFSASTILYLLMRQAHDGQDYADIWMPGMVEGTMAQSLKARAEDGGPPPDDEPGKD